jgi:hypothetical protein
VGNDKRTRHGTPCIDRFPEIQDAFGDDGKPCFESVMEQLSARRLVDRLAANMTAVFVAYDM